MTFQVISDSAISLPNIKAARPDTVVCDGKFYVSYLQLSPTRTFSLLILDKNLKLQETMHLFSGRNQPTDIRACTSPGPSISYAFETTNFQKWAPNHLNLARYQIAEPLPILVASKTKVAEGTPVIIPDALPRPGDDLVDDPTPFVYKNRFYVTTRKWGSAILKVREFSSDLQVLETRELDFGRAFPRLSLSVNSLVEIEGKPYLVTGVFNGPPIDRRFFSYVAAVDLDESITNIGRPLVLSRTGDYEGYVTCARYSEGILFVGYEILTFGRRSELKGMIKAFDAKNGFAEIGSVQVNAGSSMGNHFTFEVLDRKLYIFYQVPVPVEQLRVKVLSFRERLDN